MSNALDDLIAKVEAGVWDIMRDEPGEETGLQDHWHLFDSIMTGDSLNAALTLHKAVLPTWDWRAEENVNGYVSHIGPAREEFMPSIMAVNFESAARAWLIAILKAMKEGKDA